MSAIPPRGAASTQYFESLQSFDVEVRESKPAQPDGVGLDFDCLDLITLADCAAAASSSAIASGSEIPPARPACDLFKTDTQSGLSSGLSSLEGPGSIHPPQKADAAVVAKSAMEIGKKLFTMQDTCDSEKILDVTFADLGAMEADIKILADQKKYATSSHIFSQMLGVLRKKVIKAFTAHIETALASMQREVDKKNAAAVSIKATEDLASDCRILSLQEGQQKKGTLLFKKLEGLEAVISMAHIEADVQAIVKPPLMGEITELKKRAELYDRGDVKNGLIKLDSMFVMRSIRGDGHCLFRSTLADTLEKLLAMPDAEREARLTRLQQSLAKFGCGALNEQFAFVKQVIGEAAACARDFGDVICDEETSDKFVSFMRQLVCEYNRQIKNDVFDSFVAASGKSKDEYLDDMVSMQKASYGDHPEVQAISTLFDLNICVVEVDEYGKNTDPNKTGQAFRHFRAHDGMVELFLLHLPGHYDFGMLKNRRPKEPVEPPQARGTRYFIELAKKRGWIDSR